MFLRLGRLYHYSDLEIELAVKYLARIVPARLTYHLQLPEAAYQRLTGDRWMDVDLAPEATCVYLTCLHLAGKTAGTLHTQRARAQFCDTANVLHKCLESAVQALPAVHNLFVKPGLFADLLFEPVTYDTAVEWEVACSAALGWRLGPFFLSE